MHAFDTIHLAHLHWRLCSFALTEHSFRPFLYFVNMLSQKQVILLLTAQSAALLASAFVAPTPFGVKSLLQSKSAGPLFSDVVSAVASTSEDEAAESVVEPTEESSDTSEPAADATPAEEKQRLTVFVGNLPFRKLASYNYFKRALCVLSVLI